MIVRFLHLLERLSGRCEGVSLAELTQALDTPKSGVHRMLAQLIERGYVERLDDLGRYRLTMRLPALGLRHLARSGVSSTAQPTLDRLARRSGELVRLGVADGDGLVWVAKAQGCHSALRYDPEMGPVEDLTATATGQAWLASHSDEAAMRIAFARGFGAAASPGPDAPRTIEELLRRLCTVRERGWAIVVDSAAIGTAAVACVIRGEGSPLGTLSIAGPAARLPRERLVALAAELEEAARELGAVLEMESGLGLVRPTWHREAVV